MHKIILAIFFCSQLVIAQSEPIITYYKKKYVESNSVKRYMLTTQKINDSITTRVFSKKKTGQKIWTETYLHRFPYGVWEQYDEKGNLVSQIDYNFKVKYFRDKKKDSEASDTIQKEPKIVAFSDKNRAIIREHIKETFQYPQKASMDFIEGKVIVHFTINKMGDVVDASILKGVHWLLDAEAYRIVTSLPRLEPGQSNGENTEVRLTVPIVFGLK